MNENDNSNVEQARKIYQENAELKEKLYEEGVRKEKERRRLLILVLAVVGGLFALDFIVPYLLGLHQFGYTFLKRAIERKSVMKAWGTPAEPHILLEADAWEDAYIKQVEQMGFQIAEHTVERKLLTEKGGIFGNKYDEEINRYDLADGKGRISISKDLKGNDLISVTFFDTGDNSSALIAAALMEIGRQQGYSMEEEELRNYRNIEITRSDLEGYPYGVLYTLKGEKDTSIIEFEN